MRYLLLLFLLTSIHITYAEEQPAQQTRTPLRRPRIGLVLSGGGARGFAHVGTMRVMEEAGLRPDYIAGTSMGAILGALYAMGYTADEISTLNLQTDWGELLSNQQPLRTVTFEQKHNVNRSLLSVNWEDGHFNLPRGFINSQLLLNLFHRLSWQYATVDNFNQLPTPFGCISVNLTSGKIRTARSGHLPTEIRASMAIPGIFTPVLLSDTVLLTDGGVADNFPYDLVRAMGADIVIGSYAGPDLTHPSGILHDAKDILTHASMYAGIQKAREDLKKCDYLIAPDLAGYTSMNFTAGQRIENLGYEAASAFKTRFQKLADSIYRYEAKPPITHADTTATHWIKKVEITNGKEHKKVELATSRWLSTPSQVNARQVENAINQIYSTRFFNQIYYQLGKDSILRIMPQPRSPLSIGIGAHVNDEWGIGIMGRLELLNPLWQSSRAEFAILASSQPQLTAKHTFYFGEKQNFLFNVGGNFITSRTPLYLAASRIASIMKYELEAYISLGKLIRTSALLDGGLMYRSTFLVPSRAYLELLGGADPTRISAGEIQSFLRYRINTTERQFYPQSGYTLHLHLTGAYRHAISYDKQQPTPVQQYGLNAEFDRSPFVLQFYANYEQNIPFGKYYTLQPRLALGLSSNQWGRHYTFQIGGAKETVRNEALDIPFYGLGFRQISAYNFLLGSFSLQIHLPYSLHLTPSLGALYTATNLDRLTSTARGLLSEGIYSGELALGRETRLGIVQGSLSMHSGSRDLWAHFFIGIPF